MKLKEALKKFDFLKKLDLTDKTVAKVANHLASLVKGHSEIYFTPLAKHSNPIHVKVEWDMIFEENVHRMNQPLLDLENTNRSKFGPRSIQLPWKDRHASLIASFHNQRSEYEPRIKLWKGPGDCKPITFEHATSIMQLNATSGLPYLGKKKNVIRKLNKDDFDVVLQRKDPCMCYTRTAESNKTRNVWGYPFADTLLETMFYNPILHIQKLLPCRSALVSPDAVAQGITRLILEAVEKDKIIYSIDIRAFDTSALYQCIVEVFEFFKSFYSDNYAPYFDYMCKRVHTVAIITPRGILRGNHGVPSGSGWTNELDSMLQLGTALNCTFIDLAKCLVQGDDGVYLMYENEIPEFEAAFKYANLKIERSKSRIASDYALFCQELYHIDYIQDGIIPGIYPTYRAINRLLFQERFVNFKEMGISGKDYYSIRAFTILENCKYHPLFEELVRFVLAKEKFALDLSDDSLTLYMQNISKEGRAFGMLNQHYGSRVKGIKGFESYKMVQKILSEEDVPKIMDCGDTDSINISSLLN